MAIKWKEAHTKKATQNAFVCSELLLNETTTQMQSEPLAQPIISQKRALWMQSITHKAHLRQLSQLGSLPPQLIQDAAVKGLLLLPAPAQLRQVWIIQTGPVLCEGLGTAALDLPTRDGAQKKGCMGESVVVLKTLEIVPSTKLIQINTSEKRKPDIWNTWIDRFKVYTASMSRVTLKDPSWFKRKDFWGLNDENFLGWLCGWSSSKRCLAVARSTIESNQVLGAITAFLKSFLITLIIGIAGSP